LIFGLWRKRRQEQDDELLSAYIDRGPGGDPEVELPERLRAEAQEFAEIAALMRSVERVPAPRSFALTPEMVGASESPSFTERTGWSLALFRAPAIAAAAAAFVLGLLVIGNIAGILEQEKASDLSATSATGASFLAAQADAETAVQDQRGGSGSAAAPAAAAPAAPASGATSAAPAEATAAADVPTAASVTSDASTGDTLLAAPAPALEAPTPVMESAVEAAPGSSDAFEQAALIEAEGTDDSEIPLGPDQPPESGTELPARSGGALLPPDEALFGDGESTALDFSIGAAAPVPDDDGFTLPLWQLEVAFGLLALVLGGAAFAMKRR